MEGEELLPEAGREEATPPASSYLSLIVSQGRCWLSQLESACRCWPARETRQQRQRRAADEPEGHQTEGGRSVLFRKPSLCFCMSLLLTSCS